MAAVTWAKGFGGVMKPKAWFETLAGRYYGSDLMGGIVEDPKDFNIWDTSTGGWQSGRGLRNYSGLTLELWYDKYTSLGRGPYRLYVGLELSKKVFESLFSKSDESFAVLRDRDVAPKANRLSAHIHEEKLKQIKYGITPFFEAYNNERAWFFGKYLSFDNLHLSPRNSTGIVQQIRKFTNQTLREMLERLDEVKVLEMISQDLGIRGQRHVSAVLRNEALEREKYTCQACSYHLPVKQRWIIEVHHRTPLKDGAKVNSSKDLLVLCPNCHTVAHSLGKRPLTLLKIKAIVPRSR